MLRHRATVSLVPSQYRILYRASKRGKISDSREFTVERSFLPGPASSAWRQRNVIRGRGADYGAGNMRTENNIAERWRRSMFLVKADGAGRSLLSVPGMHLPGQKRSLLDLTSSAFRVAIAKSPLGYAYAPSTLARAPCTPLHLTSAVLQNRRGKFHTY
ncbi:hypothetical protein EJ04DRAFT_122994 [Polyplosphaeria fusca]|uniref:Uncharacterized protein n=1 Tax=Polyplosphaeria fusca TaxID=682080 RepID=A0A9P4QM27_9PLEO|nr:hypothetical protein EJ04DRAFT_122994 [Polyplosphaeria fusca]